MTLQDRRLGVSDVISLLLNPSVSTAVLFGLLTMKYEPPDSLRVVHLFLGVTFTSVIPVGMLFVLKPLGKIHDLEMSVRSERERVYLLCVTGYGLAAGLLLITGARWPLWGLLALHVPNTIVLIAFNRRLKVSVHTMVLTSLFVVALMFFGKPAMPVGILVPAAAWARWDAGNHSVAELIWGIGIGGVLTPVEIQALRSAFGG
jgi:hypothetical protein